MNLRLLWGVASALVIVFAFEPFVLSLIFGLPQSWKKFWDYMLDVPITIIAVSILGAFEAAVFSLIPFRNLSFKERLLVIFPIVVSLSTIYLIYGWAEGGYYEAQYIKKFGPILEE